MSITASMLGKGQVLVVFAGSSPENALTAATFQARRQGANVIVIAQTGSTLVHQNDIFLRMHDSRYGALMVIDLLCDGLTSFPA